MNDAQSTIVGLKAQDCPGGGWNGMPAELEGKATVADCLAHGVCGCIYGDAVQHIERARAALTTARAYIEDQPIAHAVVIPRGQHPSGNYPSLLAVIDAALNNQQVGETK